MKGGEESNMFKRILLSLGVIAVVGGAAIAGTQALLSDKVTLTGNTFSTGSVDLQIWDTTTSTYLDTTVGFTDTMMPGETSGPHVFWLKNNASNVNLAISALADVVNNGAGDYDSDDLMVTVQARTSDGMGPAGTAVTQSLTAWETETDLGLPNLPSNGEQRYHMTVALHPSVTEENTAVSFDFTFTGEQVLP